MNRQRVAARVSPAARTEQAPALLLRSLALITPVSQREVGTALLLTVQAFLTLSAYSCIKPVREAWILALPSGPEYKIYTGAAIGGCVALLVPIYAKVATFWTRDRLIVSTTLFFASQALIFHWLGAAFGASAWLAVAFYIWISVFNLMIVAQFWSFANDLYTEEAGRRLFPLFCLGASLGAVAGSAVAGLLIPRVGTRAMLPLAAGILVFSALLTRVIHERESGGRAAHPSREATQPVAERSQAFRLVFRERYLLLIALFSVLFTIVKTNGEYVLASLAKHAAVQAVSLGTLAPSQIQQFIGSFYARFQLYVNVSSLLVQAFLVSRLVRRLGIPVAFLLLPVVSLLGTAALFAWPILVVALPWKVVENAMDYSLNNTVRNMLWLPTSRRAKYLAKQVTDTVFVRVGDVASALLVFLGAHWMAWPLRTFVCINAAAIVGWLVVARAILARHRSLVRTG